MRTRRVSDGVYETLDGRYRFVRSTSADLSQVSVWDIQVRAGESWEPWRPDPGLGWDSTLRDAKRQVEIATREQTADGSATATNGAQPDKPNAASTPNPTKGEE